VPQLRTLLLLILVVLLILLLFGGRQVGPIRIPNLLALLPSGAPEAEQCPTATFRQLSPTEWDIVRTEPINLDGGDVDDCLVLYQYEHLRIPLGDPVGGVIYDAQPNRDPRNLATPFPFRPSAFIAYDLLPRHGGLGFLAETAAPTAPMTLQLDANGDNKKDLVVLGFSPAGLTTTLSIFSWSGSTETGYRILSTNTNGSIFADAGILTRPTLSNQGAPLERVWAFQRALDQSYYVRSLFARQQVWEWNADRTALVHDSQRDSLVFAFGRPEVVSRTMQISYTVTFPEQAVLAYYKDGDVIDIFLPRGVEKEGEQVVDAVAYLHRNNGVVSERWKVVKFELDSVKNPFAWMLVRN
jgi:hypothetical protein